MTFIKRKCPHAPYKTLADTGRSPGKVCISTLTDEKTPEWVGRSDALQMEGLLTLGWPNKESYAKEHGYFLFDGSSDIDFERPASWSKNLAVRRLLVEEGCDWVFWLSSSWGHR